MLFSKELQATSRTAQDHGRLNELPQHELLQSEQNTPIASFDQVKDLGRWFLSQTFDTKPLITTPIVAPHYLTAPNTNQVLAYHYQTDNQPFWGKLALGPKAEEQFPVTGVVVMTPRGLDIKLHIVPIDFGAFEVAAYSTHTDSLLALAAAAATAPQFLFALESGIITTECHTKKAAVTSLTPDHGTPLAVVFDTFKQKQVTLNQTIAITGNPNISIKQAAHLHGQSKNNTSKISLGAANSDVAAGVAIKTVLQSELPRHALFVQTALNEQSQPKIVSIVESISQLPEISSLDLSLVAAALGFTAHVVGESRREQLVETILQPQTSDTPLMNLLHHAT